MEMSLENLSHKTLVDIVEDLNVTNADLNSKNERLSTEDWESKYYDLERKYNSLFAQNQQSQFDYLDKEQIKRNVLRSMINGVRTLSNVQLIAVCGSVYEAGEKIMAVKAYQERFGIGPKESKKAVEEWRWSDHLLPFWNAQR